MQLTRTKMAPTFVKTAAQFLLGENPGTYPNELLAQLYKQHAFLGQYDVNLSIEGQDDAAGYLYGVFAVSPPVPAPMITGPQQIGMQAPPPPPDPASTLRIPVIVASRKAYSFDVFITPSGTFLPLSENRLAAAMFEGSPYAAATQTEAQLRADEAKQGFGQGSEPSAGGHGEFLMGKQGSVLSNVQIPDDMVQAFSARLQESQELLDALTIAPEFREACSRIGTYKADAPIEKTAAADTPIDVAVYRKRSGGYAVHCASMGGDRSVYLLKNAQAEQLPLEIRQRVLECGIAMSTNEAAVPLEGVERTVGMRDADETAVYAVMNKNGSARRAVVVQDPIMLDGHRTESVLVVGPDGTSLQSKVAGVRCGDVSLSELPGEEPRGEGMFLIGDRATEVVTIRNRVDSPEGTSYLYEHPLLGRGKLKMANVRVPVPTTGNDFLFPQDARFIPTVTGAGYLEDQTSVEKIASRHDLINQVQLLADGASYSLRGAPLKGQLVEDVPEEEALVVIGLLGDTADSALQKTAAARRSGSVSFVAARPLHHKQMEKRASELIDVSSVRVDLVKEAAVLSGSDTVDSVLSLNFITPENIEGYLNSMPPMEQAVQKLAELLIGVRLGLADVPESAVSASLSGIERALTGLKKLQIRVGMENRA
jgi:hypothetical protein